MSARVAISVCCALLLPWPRAAQASQALALDDVLASALRLHPLLVQARLQVTQADAAVLGAKGAFDPTLSAKGNVTPYGDYVLGKADVNLRQRTTLWGLSLVGGWRFGRGDIPVYKLEDKTSSGGQAYVGLELPLLRGGAIDKARARLYRRRFGRDGARYLMQVVELALLRAGAQAYWKWVAAGRKLVIEQRLLDIAKKRNVQLAEQVKSGALPAIEQVDNQRTILKRQGAVIAARRALERAAIKLSLFYRDAAGKPQLPKLTQLPKSLPSSRAPDSAQLARDIDHAVARRPQIAVLAAQAAAVAVTRRLARNERLPKLSLALGAEHDIGAEPYDSRRTDVLLGLSLRFPMLMRRARGKLAKAEAKLREIAAKRRWLADKIAAQVRDAYSALRAAHEQLAVARRERKVAHQVEAGERARLRLGSSTLLTVNLREQLAASADKRVVDALASYQRALADYNAVTARGFGIGSFTRAPARKGR
ncbi:MAG: TolC family protein [Myxococcales bacterium]|nr:TolC family protein [Myxococcales bacterium]